MSETEAKDKLYQLTVNNRTMFVGKPRYRAGEKVVMNIPLLTDVSTSITCDSADIGRGEVTGGCMHYEFIMPPHDVNVNYRTYGTMMMMTPTPGLTMPNFAAGETLLHCPSCNHVCRSGDNYCDECGYRLKK